MSESFFASFTQRTLTGEDLPEAPGESVTIRMLNDAKLVEAANAVQVKAYQQIAGMGGTEILNIATEIERQAKSQLNPDELAKAKANQAARVAQVKADPYLAYDEDTLIRLGTVKWSFKDPDKKLVAINDENIQDMRPKALKERIGRAIFALARPDEAAVKNASAPSSVN